MYLLNRGGAQSGSKLHACGPDDMVAGQPARDPFCRVQFVPGAELSARVLQRSTSHLGLRVGPRVVMKKERNRTGESAYKPVLIRGRHPPRCSAVRSRATDESLHKISVCAAFLLRRQPYFLHANKLSGERQLNLSNMQSKDRPCFFFYSASCPVVRAPPPVRAATI